MTWQEIGWLVVVVAFIVVLCFTSSMGPASENNPLAVIAWLIWLCLLMLMLIGHVLSVYAPWIGPL